MADLADRARLHAGLVQGLPLDAPEVLDLRGGFAQQVGDAHGLGVRVGDLAARQDEKVLDLPPHAHGQLIGPHQLGEQRLVVAEGVLEVLGEAQLAADQVSGAGGDARGEQTESVALRGELPVPVDGYGDGPGERVADASDLVRVPGHRGQGVGVDGLPALEPVDDAGEGLLGDGHRAFVQVAQAAEHRPRREHDHDHDGQ